MEKVAYFTRAILQELIVVGSESDIQPPEAGDAMKAMNDWAAMQDALGVSIGYTSVSNAGDDVTIPTGANVGLIKNVAVYMAPQFGATVRPETAIMAEQGLRAMRNLAPQEQPMAHPSTFPLGARNEWCSGGSNNHFYPGPDSEILTEQDGSILVESGTT